VKGKQKKFVGFWGLNMADVSELGRRLQAVRGNESLDAFAQQLEVHRNTLFRYEKGESYPDARIIYMLRMKFDVNPNWLISGDGPMHSSEAQLDKELLRKAMRVVRSLYDERPDRLDPDEEEELIFDLHDLFLGKEEELTVENLRKLVKTKEKLSKI
jgi:transcriptional regulator with XRE-family HTH domain